MSMERFTGSYSSASPIRIAMKQLLYGTVFLRFKNRDTVFRPIINSHRVLTKVAVPGLCLILNRHLVLGVGCEENLLVPLIPL